MDSTALFGGVFGGKTVLVTGDTGFKGSWLSIWLSMLGAKVVGYSAYLPSDPCNFSVCGLDGKLTHIDGDVRDIERLKSVFDRYRPEIVFHLAAQPIVRTSYLDPKLTFDSNVGGTVNVLECLRTSGGVKAAVMITSDKCYRNVEWVWGYRENDRLGGDDPYSASKACAEMVCNAYIKSFFSGDDAAASVATVRAGNVIGGGDWADARIVPDCVRAWARGEKPVIRNPEATRPWQHVLEPLSGYLHVASRLLASRAVHGEAFNFGPDQTVNKPVRELIEAFLPHWGDSEWRFEPAAEALKESMLLKLSCDKALHMLDWHPVFSFDETVRLTAEWYRAYYGGGADMHEFTIEQIAFYVDSAKTQHLVWTGGR